ncbi:hypothetical protein H6F42_06135 [Pseudanabaena sp. FACHB-1998]|uniref:hypothetical protein n=1 Tax=Pseudanabaena sp. FACHB-1998 TaxID=2692858 RepID=UPI001681495F|nr:hypothetical protein [Pseudanabaena sp. FACHB-1998]MBD2176494.1 hypothetical protein [Pseudanabaena sp. FACHB-1998]
MSADRQVTLKRLLRAIALSVGDFALLLARFNSIEVRDRLVADLKAQLGSSLYRSPYHGCGWGGKSCGYYG